MSEPMKPKLTAADLYVILNTLVATLNVRGLNTVTSEEARKIVIDKIEDIIHSMELTLVIENEETQK